MGTHFLAISGALELGKRFPFLEFVMVYGESCIGFYECVINFRGRRSEYASYPTINFNSIFARTNEGKYFMFRIFFVVEYFSVKPELKSRLHK